MDAEQHVGSSLRLAEPVQNVMSPGLTQGGALNRNRPAWDHWQGASEPPFLVRVQSRLPDTSPSRSL